MNINDDVIRIKNTIIKAVPAEKIYLFGSYANGTSNENSDYDFYVVVPNDSIRPLDAIKSIYRSIGRTIKKPVDILAGTAEAFERRSKQITLERIIEKSGVVIYDGK